MLNPFTPYSVQRINVEVFVGGGGWVDALRTPVQMFTFTRCFSRALSVYAVSDRMASRSMKTQRLV